MLWIIVIVLYIAVAAVVSFVLAEGEGFPLHYALLVGILWLPALILGIIDTIREA